MSGQRTSFSLSFPAQAEYLVLCRLAVTALGRLVRLDDELVDDLKLAVTEACTNVVQHAYSNGAPGSVDLTFEEEDGLVRVMIEDAGIGHTDALSNALDDREGGMGLAIIRSLVDELTLDPRSGSQGTRVTLTKRR